MNLIQFGEARGKAISIIELLKDIGQVSEDLSSRIMDEKDVATLSRWLKLAAKAESIDYFVKQM